MYALSTRCAWNKWIVLGCLCVALQGSGAESSFAQDAQLAKATEKASAITLTAYEAELEHEAQLIPRIKSQPAEVAHFRAALPLEWVVDTGGEEVSVSTEWLDAKLAELQANPKRANEVAQSVELRLAAMLESAEKLDESRAHPTAGTAARQHLDSIFQRKEFAGLKGPSEFERWEERAARWVAAKILWLLQHVHLGAGSGNFLAWGVIGLAFLALGYWAYRSLFRSSRRAAMPQAEEAPSNVARNWLREAQAAAERGEYRQAMHGAYWAAVARLEDVKLLTRDRARTPRESLRQLQEHPAQQDSLRELTRHLELIWYGYRPASADDWSSARLQLERMGCLKGSTAATGNY